MCARDSGIDYGCQISGLKALPACATPPVGGASQWHLCCVLALSTRFRRSPPPHTHMPRGAILCRQLPEILHASSIRIIVAIVAHIELQMCVCVCQWGAKGGAGGAPCAHGGTTTMRPRKTKCFNALHASSSAYLSELRIYVCNRNSSFCGGVTGTGRITEREGECCLAVH